MSTDNMSVLWIDAGGGSTLTLIRSTSGAGTILADMLAKSNADKLNTWEGVVQINATPAPVAAPNQSVLTQASLVFKCVDNSQVTLNLPAPKASIFLSDGVTVDATQIAALIAACIGTLVSQSGSPASAYISGLLTRRSVPP